MAIAGLFDHRVGVYRPAEQRTAMGAVEVWSALVPATYGPHNAKVTEPDMSLEAIGSGEMPQGRYIVSMRPGVDVQERDILRVLVGPDSVVNLRVLSASYPRGHHMKAICERVSEPLELP